MPLGDLEERRGSDHAVAVAHAKQGLVAGDLVRCEIENRLVVEDEQVPFEGIANPLIPAEARLDGSPRAGRGGHAVATGILGDVHRPVGGGQNLAAVVDRRARVVAGDPDARRDADRASLDRQEVLAQGAEDGCANHRRSRLVRARHEDRELVAVEAGKEVVATDPSLENARDATQQVIAGGVAEGVVDVLEVVEVEQQDGAD